MRAFLLLSSTLIFARAVAGAIESDGAVDLTFQPGVIDSGAVRGAALQDDGKLVISGVFQSVNGVACDHNARLNPDGTVDQSFVGGTNSFYYHLLVQADGKILAWSDYELVRLNADGSLDASFNIGDRLVNPFDLKLITAVILQPDGKLIVTGNFSQAVDSSGVSYARNQAARFNADGSLDTGFVPNPQVSEGNAVLDAVLQTNGPNAGKVVFLWGYWNYSGSPSAAYGVGRMNLDGSLDSTFTPPSNNDYGWYVYGYGLFAQSDDRILIFSSYAPYSSDHRTIVRLNAKGTLDTSFSAEGFDKYREFGYVQRVSQLANGKLLVAGQFHSVGAAQANGIVRLETNGARDPSFSSSGIGPVGQGIYDLVVRPSDGKIFIDGYFGTAGGAARHNIAWLNPDGSADSTLDGVAGPVDGKGNIYAFATQADGKILAGGFFNSVNGAPHSSLVRLKVDGSVDDSFAVTQGVLGSVYTINLQADGKIIMGGSFLAVDGVARGKSARLNSDGTLDQAFDPNATDGSVFSTALDESGNIFIGGNFYTVGGAVRNRLAKLNSSGVVDQGFAPSAPTSTVRAIVASNNTSGVIVAGDFNYFGNIPARRIGRLNAVTGAYDATFNSTASSSTAGFNSSVYALLRAADGKYYAGGNFGSYNGTNRGGVARLNADGSLDTTFANPALSFTRALALQNGKVLAASTNSSDLRMTFLDRIAASGQIESSFVSGSGTVAPPSYDSIYLMGLAISPGGRVLLGGTFDHYNGVERSGLLRLTDSRLVGLKINSLSRNSNGDVLLQGIGTANTSYVIEASSDLNPATYSSIGSATCDSAGVWHFTDSSLGNLTRRFYRLTLPRGSSGQRASSSSRWQTSPLRE